MELFPKQFYGYKGDHYLGRYIPTKKTKDDVNQHGYTLQSPTNKSMQSHEMSPLCTCNDDHSYWHPRQPNEHQRTQEHEA